MIRNDCNLDGSPLDPKNGTQTVQADHMVQTFTVRIRSMQPVDPGVLMRHINQRFEVVGDLTCDRRDTYYRVCGG